MAPISVGRNREIVEILEAGGLKLAKKVALRKNRQIWVVLCYLVSICPKTSTILPGKHGAATIATRDG